MNERIRLMGPGDEVVAELDKPEIPVGVYVTGDYGEERYFTRASARDERTGEEKTRFHIYRECNSEFVDFD